MSTRKLHPRTRALKPSAEGLEDRRLLSGVVSGTDIDGDTWTLRLIGPGAISVTKQNGANGQPGALNSATEINTITVAGTNATTSRLVGTVVKGANGDGKVFFQNFNKIASNAEGKSTGNGLLSVSMPSFWLGNTTPYTSSSTTVPAAPTMDIPDGTGTLQFGGVDTTHDQPATPPSSAASDQAVVELGPPARGGTRIIIDKAISSAVTVPSTSSSSTTNTIQHGVVFAVSGRLDLFQANEIDGNSTTPPGQFAQLNSGATGFGGTWVVSGTPGVFSSFFTNPSTLGGLTGQIGDLRVGGNATNLTTLVYDGTGNLGAKISNFSVGGETNNVMVVAPNGARNLYFGNGLDNTQIYAHVINSIQANRGAINATVQSDRPISRLQFGGDVVNSSILSGYTQSYTTLIDNITGLSSVSTFSPTASPTAPTQLLNAQVGGGMSVLVAGDITNSVFAASTQPGIDAAAGPTTFGGPNDLRIGTGHIYAKVEGSIDNSSATPSKPTVAFYAQNVNLKKGPVIPPSVPQAPYGPKIQPSHTVGVPHVNPTRVVTAPTKTKATKK